MRKTTASFLPKTHPVSPKSEYWRLLANEHIYQRAFFEKTFGKNMNQKGPFFQQPAKDMFAP
jgi:hypothetical protein